MAIIYMDGLIDKNHVSKFTIGYLVSEEDLRQFTLKGYQSSLLDIISKEVIS